MSTTIDGGGRVVIPKSIREAAGFKPGMRLRVVCRDGRVEIEPEPLPVEIVRRGRLRVASPAATVAPLKASVVEDTRRELAGERVEATGKRPAGTRRKR